VAEHEGGVRAHGGGGSRADVLRFLHREVHRISRAQDALPACKQIVETDADGDAAVDAGHAQNWLDALATMRIGTVGAGQDHQFRPFDRRGTRQLRVDLLSQETERERAVEDAAEHQRVQQERREAGRE
jgi:hypothetical protein